MAISINEISNGMGLLVNGSVYIVSEVHHVKPGKGSAFVRVKMKNLKTDLNLERTFKTADRLDDIDLEERRLQYLYRTGDTFHFMDQTSYEERAVSLADMGDAIKFLQDNMEITVAYYNGQIQKVYLPNFITARIIETEPGFKGDSSRAGNKPATIDTGAAVQVPLFIDKGDWVKIDTRTGQYVERVQK